MQDAALRMRNMNSLLLVLFFGTTLPLSGSPYCHAEACRVASHNARPGVLLNDFGLANGRQVTLRREARQDGFVNTAVTLSLKGGGSGDLINAQRFVTAFTGAQYSAEFLTACFRRAGGPARPFVRALPTARMPVDLVCSGASVTLREARKP